MFDLKKFRETNLGITQSELAEKINERQDFISRLEQSSGQIPLEILIKIAGIAGTTLDELVNYERQNPLPLVVADTWRTADFTKKSLGDYISKSSSDYRNLWGHSYDKYIIELTETIERVISKPKIAVMGHSDVGKSRLINSIIGAEKMPISWTPTTAITVYIKHINDRPFFIEEETWVFRLSNQGQCGWDEKRLGDEEYCRAWKLAGGNSAILKDYGTRQGELFEKNDAGAAVIFVESDFLKDCDLIDLPGFGTGDRAEDDEMTIKAKEFADILIFMSVTNSFMHSDDIEYLKETINSLNVIENKKENELKPLNNLFVVSSQAHIVEKGKKDLGTILDCGCERFMNTLPQGFWDNKESVSGYKYDYNALRNRFFTYTTNTEILREQFENDLRALIETLPKIIDEKAKKYISEYIKSTGVNMDKEIAEYSNIISQRDKYEYLLREIEKNEPRRANESQNRRIDLLSDIKTMRRNSVSNFAEYYGKTISADSIVNVIKEKGFKKKKDDVNALASYINSSLQGELQNILKVESKILKDKVDKFVADFEGSIKYSDLSSAAVDFKFSFDATRAFASGLAGLATFGGLALWVSTLGNLGAYILISQGVGILSALGISVGGTAAAAAAVAAIGGPVVLGIAIAIIAALAVFTFLSGGWEKKLSKKIVKEYDSKNCLMKYKGSIEKFWDDTEKAFNKAANSLDVEWKQYVETLKEMLSTHDVHEINKKIRMAEEFKNFLSGIPL